MAMERQWKAVGGGDRAARDSASEERRDESRLQRVAGGTLQRGRRQRQTPPLIGQGLPVAALARQIARHETASATPPA